MMKTIGFIDYYISEWHANTYPALIKKMSEKLGYDVKLKYAYAELDVSPVDGVTTDEWCEKYGVTRAYSIDELCEKSDFIIILAPSNPEKHLGYAREALPFGKLTYIDKTFAPDYKTALEIFDIAASYGTKIFSSSALRYAEELDLIAPCDRIEITGGGSNFEEYIIHQVEMLTKKMGIGALSCSAKDYGDEVIGSVKYKSGAAATLRWKSGLPFTVSADGKSFTMESPFFDDLLGDILRFFAEGTLSFDPAETLEVMKIREALVTSYKTGGKEITL